MPVTNRPEIDPRRGPQVDASRFVPLTIKRECAVVHLTKGLFALVDASDWLRIFSMGKWQANGVPGGEYARLNSKRHGRIFMHNAVLATPAGRYPDHRNRRRLDNRTSNLRVATKAQNSANSFYANKIGYRGVTTNTQGFQARITIGGVRIGLGTFPTAGQAAIAYDQKARDAFGEFAILNFPLHGGSLAGFDERNEVSR